MIGNGVNGRCTANATRSAHRKTHPRDSRMARGSAGATNCIIAFVDRQRARPHVVRADATRDDTFDPPPKG
jgi:hypothetical protein